MNGFYKTVDQDKNFTLERKVEETKGKNNERLRLLPEWRDKQGFWELKGSDEEWNKEKKMEKRGL